MSRAALSKKIFPAALILERRPCLVVGGGRVAVRKAAKLAAAGARLTVVAPQINPRLRELPDATLIERPFEPADLDGAFAVFALTDDRALNRRLIELCRERRILCSAADASWPDGDFILPASFTAEGLTVAISTSGRSCRRSRLLRESLDRHVRFLSDMELLLIGLDHRAADLAALERLKQARPELELLLAGLWGVHEFMVLDTCNRFEIAAAVSAGSVAALETLLRRFGGTEPVRADGFAAFRRLAATAAGLNAQAFGESRIVAQLKQALADAQQRGQAGSLLQSWTDSALHLSKEIRRLPGFDRCAAETEDLVCAYLRLHRPDPGRILLIGRGEIGGGLLQRFPQAVQIGGRSDEEIRRHLPAADTVLCAAGATGFLLDETHRSLLRPGALLLDLSLPRTVNPALPGAAGLSALRAALPPENAADLFRQADALMETRRNEYERLVRLQ